MVTRYRQELHERIAMAKGYCGIYEFACQLLEELDTQYGHASNKPEILLRRNVSATEIPRLSLDVVSITKNCEGP